MLRPAGILIPSRDQLTLIAGLNQIEADIMKVGMLGEVTCAAKPFTVIPCSSRSFRTIAAGQLRQTAQLVDVQEISRSGSITVSMQPLYEGGFQGIPLGSTNCIANVSTSNHDRLESEDMSPAAFVFLHAVDTLGLVHTLILRLQARLLPVTTLVVSGH